MARTRTIRPAFAAALGLFVAACGARVPAAPADPGATVQSSRASAQAEPQPDVRFMRDMIVHHGQALDMTALVAERARGEDVRRLAMRIEAAQQDEIARMRRWLAAQGEPAEDAHAHHGDHRMPGMLSAEEMDRLAAATGESFDRLFIESMIRHHEGALVMVAELFEGGGATRDVEVFQLASQIDADQRAEIARMRRMAVTGR